MTLFGRGCAAIRGDRAMAERLGWARRRRSDPDPDVVLEPRAGDGRAEPWIAPPGWRPFPGPEALWRRGRVRGGWTYLAGIPGVARYLERLAAPRGAGGARVGLIGLGRVGGTAAAVLASLPSGRSGVAELLIDDADAANRERWLLELQAVAQWKGPHPGPRVAPATPEAMFRACDAVLFAAAEAVPPIGHEGDVRMCQLEPNRAILAPVLAAARRAEFAGLFLVVSDPVEWLAQAAFRDSNAGRGGRFTGEGIAPERIAGLALGVMWGRALACARRRGWLEAVNRRGAAYGPHSTDVAVFDDLRAPNPGRCAVLSAAAREGNFALRDIGHLPYVGPAISSVALALPRLLSGREVLASVWLGGIYFGAPARLRWGVLPAARPMAGSVRAELTDLHGRLAARRAELGMDFSTQ
ncbi:MAG: hypothetical protein ACOY3Y_02930 [Acidobacteriota bacterium]